MRKKNIILLLTIVSVLYIAKYPGYPVRAQINNTTTTNTNDTTRTNDTNIITEPTQTTQQTVTNPTPTKAIAPTAAPQPTATPIPIPTEIIVVDTIDNTPPIVVDDNTAIEIVIVDTDTNKVITEPAPTTNPFIQPTTTQYNPTPTTIRYPTPTTTQYNPTPTAYVYPTSIQPTSFQGTPIPTPTPQTLFLTITPGQTIAPQPTTISLPTPTPILIAPTPVPTGTSIIDTVQNVITKSLERISLEAPPVEELSDSQIFIDTQLKPLSLIQRLFSPFIPISTNQQSPQSPLSYISIDKVNTVPTSKTKIIAYARFGDGTKVEIKDSVLDIIKRRLALYNITVGVVGERAFYIEHGLINLTPGRVVTSYPLLFDLVQNRVQVLTPTGVKIVNMLPDQTAQYLIDSNTISAVDKDTLLQLTSSKGNLVYVVRGTSRQHFLGLIPVSLSRLAITSAEKTSGSIQIHQSLTAKAIDLASL